MSLREDFRKAWNHWGYLTKRAAAAERIGKRSEMKEAADFGMG
jgi:hypothetical protein